MITFLLPEEQHQHKNGGGCAFLRARAGQQRETLAYPPKALTLTDKDVQFLNELKVTW